MRIIAGNPADVEAWHRETEAKNELLPNEQRLWDAIIAIHNKPSK